MLRKTSRKTFTEQHDRQIEQYQRAIKQICNIGHFQVRSKAALNNHLLVAICGFVQRQKLSAIALKTIRYSIQRNLMNDAIATFYA